MDLNCQRQKRGQSTVICEQAGFVRIFLGRLLHRRRRAGVEPLKLVIFHLMHFADIVRFVACIMMIIIIIIIIIINGFLMTPKVLTLKDTCEYIMLCRTRMSDAFLADTICL